MLVFCIHLFRVSRLAQEQALRNLFFRAGGNSLKLKRDGGSFLGVVGD